MVELRPVIEDVLVAMLAEGNVLLEGVPGIGKTYLVRTLGQVLRLQFRRVQFTADLMPSDIVGTSLLVQDEHGKRLAFQPGPLFTNLLLADEINRATPKTQAALLEAMEEHTVSVGGQTTRLEEPFFILATQNPIEQDGTYPLPKAQLDKFLLKLVVGCPSEAGLAEIAMRTTFERYPQVEAAADGPTIRSMQRLAREVPVAAHVEDFALRVARATQPDSPAATLTARRYLESGTGRAVCWPSSMLPKVSCLGAWELLRGPGRRRGRGRAGAPASDPAKLGAEAEDLRPDEILRRIVAEVLAQDSPRHDAREVSRAT